MQDTGTGHWLHKWRQLYRVAPLKHSKVQNHEPVHFPQFVSENSPWKRNLLSLHRESTIGTPIRLF
jgi:hypothetical protein